MSAVLISPMVVSARFMFQSGSYEGNQGFHILKGIIVSDDPFAVIDDAGFFVALQAVQQGFFSVSFRKQRKAVGLDLGEKALFAAFAAFPICGLFWIMGIWSLATIRRRIRSVPLCLAGRTGCSPTRRTGPVLWRSVIRSLKPPRRTIWTSGNIWTGC